MVHWCGFQNYTYIAVFRFQPSPYFRLVLFTHHQVVEKKKSEKGLNLKRNEPIYHWSAVRYHLILRHFSQHYFQHSILLRRNADIIVLRLFRASFPVLVFQIPSSQIQQKATCLWSFLEQKDHSNSAGFHYFSHVHFDLYVNKFFFKGFIWKNIF